MRIALLAHLRHPIAEPYSGGLERHTGMLARELQARGHDVTVFAAPGSRVPGKFVAVDPGPPVSHRSGEHESACRESLYDAYDRALDQIELGGFDVVHNNSLHFLPWLRAPHMRTPFVHVLHTPPLREVVDACRAVGRGASGRVLAVSRAVGELWSPYVGDYEVVHNGVAVERWRYSTRPVPNLSVFVGRIVPEKGAHLALDAARMTGRQLIVAGPRDFAHEDYFAAEIAPRLDRERRYVGHLDTLATSQLISNAESLLFTSTWAEPFGLVLVESLACGTPVVGFAAGAAPEIVDENTGILVPVNALPALAEGLDEIPRIDRRACRRRAADHFALETMIEKYERAYRREPVREPLAQPALGRNAFSTAGLSIAAG